MEKHYTSFLFNVLAVSSIIILLSSHACLQAKAQALCYSQFALANEACSFLRPGRSAQDEPKPDPKDEHTLAPLRDGHHHHHDHRNSDDGNHDRRADPTDSACCRRLSTIDNACVCQVLARLPPFISRPTHSLIISPVKGCDVSFQCDGLL